MLKDQRADGQFAIDHRLRPEEKKRGTRDLADILNGILALGGQHGGGKGRADIGGKPLLPLRRDNRLDCRRLQRLHPDHRFHQQLLAECTAVELLVDAFLEEWPDEKADGEIERNRGNDDPGELGRIGKQHEDEDDGEDEVEAGEQTLPGQKVADGFKLAHPRHGLARRPCLEIAERQVEQMPEQPPSQFHIDAVGRVRQRIGA
jgi:hypothetical protein